MVGVGSGLNHQVLHVADRREIECQGRRKAGRRRSLAMNEAGPDIPAEIGYIKCRRIRYRLTKILRHGECPLIGQNKVARSKLAISLSQCLASIDEDLLGRHSIQLDARLRNRVERHPH